MSGQDRAMSGQTVPRAWPISSLEDLRRRIGEHHVETVCLRSVDLNGTSRQVCLPAATVNEDLLARGIGIGASSFPAVRGLESSDMKVVPDLGRVFMDPCTDAPTLVLVCDVVNADNTPFVRDARAILRRAVEHLATVSGGREVLVLPELEFYIFDDVRYATEMNRSSYVVDTIEGRWNTDRREDPNLGYKLERFRGMQAIPPRDHLYELRNEMAIAMLACGIPVRYHHHEAGGPAQCEVELAFSPMDEVGDHLQIAKDVVKQVAVRNGRLATFMPKPLFDEAGNGLHFHFNLTDGQRSLFYEKGQYGSLSELARFAIGGLLYHTPALMALTNCTTNSYRRFGQLAAPTNLFYSVGNRSAAVRIPAYGMSPTEQRIEYRVSDGAGSPHLKLAALAAAMADGIQQRITPQEHGFGPWDVNVYELSEAERSTMKSSPTRLEDALAALRDDHAFLEAGGIFDDGFVEAWTRLKVEQEVDAVAVRPHPYEFTLYLDR
ncbi:MAG TPA: glutamine synthetase beta-grasp domain-containing protein [Thermoleophilia bacterium]|nr:glutamine synthetase beta-grasp domain-containing protein [Thermoleophilia bacterium]